jgi:hypothetical protein
MLVAFRVARLEYVPVKEFVKTPGVAVTSLGIGKAARIGDSDDGALWRA